MKNLFNKNHIEISYSLIKQRIKKQDFIEVNIITKENTKPYLYYDLKIKTKKVKKVSKLGFYYIGEEKIGGCSQDYTLTEYIVNFPDSVYRISYYNSYNETSIGVDSRPWEIVTGDSYMSDSDISALFEELTKFYNKFLNYKIKVKISTEKNLISAKEAYNLLSSNINTEIFGNKNGPCHQTDINKIISHGFDVKTSFRKRKEIKK